MRETTRVDRPRGREAQCPICCRTFTSDTACEKHKPYKGPVTEGCKDPADLGFKAIERRGVTIWSTGVPDGRFRRDVKGMVEGHRFADGGVVAGIPEREEKL